MTETKPQSKENIETTMFVYMKDGIARVYDIGTVINLNEKLLEEGWTHTDTFLARGFIEKMINMVTDSPEEVIKKIKELTTRYKEEEG